MDGQAVADQPLLKCRHCGDHYQPVHVRPSVCPYCQNPADWIEIKDEAPAEIEVPNGEIKPHPWILTERDHILLVHCLIAVDPKDCA